MNSRLPRCTGLGAVLGLAAGLLLLGVVLLADVRCLPFHISMPPPPWPWYCSDPAYGLIAWLAFPVNLLTNDLSQALLLAPLSLLLYMLLGAGIGWLAGTAHGPQVSKIPPSVQQ